MTIEEMKKRKEELMYTCADISDKSEIPLSTVQKVFCGATARPRRKTMEALDLVLKNKSYDCWNGEKPSARWPRQGEYTVEDFLAMPDDMHAELIDGVIYDLGAPMREHQHVLGQIYYEFFRCVEEHGSNCDVLFAPFDVRLDGDDKTMVEPDLMVICPGHEYKNEFTEIDREKRYNGAPDLVLEVLSPSTRRKDCTIKLRKYMNAGVKEYWIVDIKNEKVFVYVFDEDELPTQYSFDDTIPIGISGGKCSIDFRRIKARLGKARTML